MYNADETSQKISDYHYKGIEYEKPKYKKEFHFGG